MPKLKFLFIYSNLSLGGVQTLILRMSKWLHDQGHDVELIVWDAADGSMLAQIQPYAKVHVINLRQYQLLQIKGAASLRFLWSKFDVVHAFDSSSMWIATHLARAHSARLFVGVYHPEAYQFAVDNSTSRYLAFDKELFSRLPDCAITFMNEGTLKSHANYYQRSFEGSPLLPLPIYPPAGSATIIRVPSRQPYRIVSVGRFVDFKVYPIGVMDAVHKLRRQGYDIQFDLYGYGPFESEFRNHALHQGYDNFVNFHGTVPYENLPSVLQDAYAFTGMGTSLLEAAVWGIPSLAMKLYSKDAVSYGFLSEQTGFNVGEDGIEHSIVDLLSSLLSMSSVEYQNLCEREREAARRFTIDSVMSQYLDLAKQKCLFPQDFSVPSAIAMLFSRLKERHL